MFSSFTISCLGYYAYGASAGREWYFNPAMQFKDDTISEADLALLNKAFDMVSFIMLVSAFAGRRPLGES